MNRPSSMPSQEELVEWFHYDIEGFLVWKKDPKACIACKRINEGSLLSCSKHGSAGCLVGKRFGDTKSVYSNPQTRRRALLNGKALFAYRLIYQWHNGNIANNSKLVIDHIDKDPQNDRIENLRLISQSNNQTHGGNKFRGVGKYGINWVAYFQEDKILVPLYIGDSEEEAIKTRKEFNELLKEKLNGSNDIQSILYEYRESGGTAFDMPKEKSRLRISESRQLYNLDRL